MNKSTSQQDLNKEKKSDSTDYPVKDNPKMDAGIAPRADANQQKKVP